MRYAKRVLAALAFAAGLAAGVPAAASASPLVPAGPPGYRYSQAEGNVPGANVGIAEHTTQLGTQIWINGKPSCVPFGGGVVTWCGVGGGNGSGILDTGFNYLKVVNGKSTAFWFRLDIYATPSSKCTVRGNMWDQRIIYCTV